MKTDVKYLVCKHCGNVAEKLFDSGVDMMCCGEVMADMKAGTSDGATEKHVPVVSVEGSTVSVQVGSVLHPMMEEHYIGWIWLQTQQGGQRAKLAPPNDAPKAVFALAPGDKAIAVYEWCNLHGLWKTEL